MWEVDDYTFCTFLDVNIIIRMELYKNASMLRSGLSWNVLFV